jgi:hypothetical protein
MGILSQLKVASQRIMRFAPAHRGAHGACRGGCAAGAVPTGRRLPSHAPEALLVAPGAARERECDHPEGATTRDRNPPGTLPRPPGDDRADEVGVVARASRVVRPRW